ncbi:MAG TPA: hypothetical protein VKP30_10410, partial [Polyangiaceae bacterium]|nr:hypothetical protein [Polyangiaceae bacterium]
MFLEGWLWQNSRQVPLPNDWPEYSKRGLLAAVALAHRAMVFAHSWCVNSRIARVRLAAENVALRARVALLQEQMRIKDARLMHIPPQCRPHYPPTERLAILALKASQGWNNAQTARAFLVTAETVARWFNTIEGEGKEALVALPAPVNRFPDFVALLVQQLKTICPIMGKKRIADTLARAGLHLSSSTVARFLKPAKPSTPTSNGCPATQTAPKRIVTAKHAGHVWHVDLTAVPTCLGFWIPWFPYSWAQHWPFCFWVEVIVDHFSRKAVLLRRFRGTPSALD